MRGIELSDEEFQEIVKSDRGQEMLQKIEGLQKVMQDEDDARGNQIAALQQQQHKHRHAIFFGLRCCRVCCAGHKSKTRHSTRSHETGKEPQSSRPAPCFDQSWTESMQ